jgi:hypothetical protein
LSIPLPNIFKLIESHGLSSELFDDDLYSIKYKYQIILKIISQYVKKYVAISALSEDNVLERTVKSSINSSLAKTGGLPS